MPTPRTQDTNSFVKPIANQKVDFLSKPTNTQMPQNIGGQF